jgi:hypothetical protein
VLHRKTPHGRDVGGIVRRLVRNEGVVAHRYAPEAELGAVRERWLSRRRAVAEREGVMEAFEAGLGDLEAALREEPRRPLDARRWDRFIGLAAAREAVARAREREAFETAAVVMPEGAAPGKGREEIERALDEQGVRVVRPEDAEAWVVGTLSPGAAADAASELGARADGRDLISCAEARFFSRAR